MPYSELSFRSEDCFQATLDEAGAAEPEILGEVV